MIKLQCLLNNIYKEDAGPVVIEVLENRSFSLMLKIKHIVESKVHWHKYLPEIKILFDLQQGCP